MHFLFKFSYLFNRTDNVPNFIVIELTYKEYVLVFYILYILLNHYIRKCLKCKLNMSILVEPFNKKRYLVGT